MAALNYSTDTYSPEYMLQRQRDEYIKQQYLTMHNQQYQPLGFGSGQPGQQAVEKQQPQPKQNKKLLLLTT